MLSGRKISTFCKPFVSIGLLMFVYLLNLAVNSRRTDAGGLGVVSASRSNCSLNVLSNNCGGNRSNRGSASSTLMFEKSLAYWICAMWCASALRAKAK